MDWILTSLNWYMYLFLLGLVVFPAIRGIFHGFIDRGYAFAKTIAILLFSYATFVLGIYRIAPFTRPVLIGLIAAFVAFFALLKWKKGQELLPDLRWGKHMFIYIFEELLFLGSLLFLAYIRGQEPSIRGLEKFMDYGFMNSILRSRFFPPLDIWYAGGNPINYYYFGHLTGAMLIKLTGIQAAVGYNLILATILAQAVTIVFSICGTIAHLFGKSFRHSLIAGLIGTFIVNFAGNLHTIYLFTSGYNSDNPVPFWQILDGYNPTKYWYPNATRFIPFTIHEFPSYSYVVADLHGHVFDIPFVLLTIAILFIFFLKRVSLHKPHEESMQGNLKNTSAISSFLTPITTNYYLLASIALGFMTAIHYMTNAFDGPIYLLFAGLLLFVMFGINYSLFFYGGVMALSFFVFSFPFSSHFSPFVSGIGLNCSPDFLVAMGKIGPFLFEKGNCQPDPVWMLFILWGFFWICFLLFFTVKYIQQKHRTHESKTHTAIDDFIFLMFTFGTLLVFIPEFFYIKDIYPAHFRANTMFKLGYQAFIIMGIASSYVFYRILILNKRIRIVLCAVYLFFLAFVFIYPFFSFPSYYGSLNKKPQLNGTIWLNSFFPEDREIIDYLNENINNQPTLLEAQGDSYTDYERISSYTGLPTVAGWWVHEWLWRGSADVVGKRIPDIVSLYESTDLQTTRRLIEKYNIKYIVVSRMEREKYKNLYEEKWSKLGRKIFQSSNKLGALYQVDFN